MSVPSPPISRGVARRGWILLGCIVLLGGAASWWLERRVTSQLVDKTLASQQARVREDVHHFNRSLQQAERSLSRYARVLSSPSPLDPGEDARLESIVAQDPDGAWRSRPSRFDPRQEAGVWIPPGVPLTPETRRFFVRAQRITTLFGLGAGTDLLANTWVLPLTNGEVIFWPGNPRFIVNASADLDYRSTPWVQLTAPGVNPQGRPRWTSPDYDPAAREWLISVVAPFYKDGRWAGAVGHDLVLADLLRWLNAPDPGQKVLGSTPLFVARRDGQLLVRQGATPSRGQTVPAHYRPVLAKALRERQRARPSGANLELITLADGGDLLIVAPLPALDADVLYRVDGTALRRLVEQELTWLQIGEVVFVLVLCAASVGLLLREARLRRQQRRQLEIRNSDLQQLVEERTADLQVANRQLERLTLEDPLTGLGNRRCLELQLQRAWGDAARREEPLSLVMLDVDFFKAYNDQLGHQRGDECLRALAQVLRSGLRRPVDSACRYGGEEFVLLLPGTDAVGSRHLAELLLQATRACGMPHPHTPSGFVSISLGVATARPSHDPSGSPEALIARADAALYRAKRAGRDRIEQAPQP